MKSAARRLVQTTAGRFSGRGDAGAPTDASGSPLDHYVTDAPTPQHIVDLFEGEWTSAFPPDSGAVTVPGNVPLFGDVRIEWALEVLGGAAGRRIVELGPLEGAHTTMIERAGAASIDAVEANGRAFLRCLCTKEVLGLTVSRFHLGDGAGFLAAGDSADRYDIGFACGVLYHMQDPIRLLDLLGRRCDRVFLWTHYFDEELVSQTIPDSVDRFGGLSRGRVDDFEYEYADQRYLSQLEWSGFCGGPAEGSKWLTRDSLDRALRRAGFDVLEYGFEAPDGPGGPSVAVCASRSETTVDADASSAH